MRPKATPRPRSSAKRGTAGALDRLVILLGRALDVPVATIATFGAGGEEIVRAGVGVTAALLPLARSISRVVAEAGTPLVIPDAYEHEGVHTVRAGLGAPLHDASGAVVGALCAIGEAPRDWTEDDLNSLLDVTELVEAELARLGAEHEDPLTGLPNRAHAASRLAEVLHRRRAAPVGVLLLDLVDFKAVGDAFGRQVADEVLRAVAGRLTGALGDDGMLAHVGHGEFLVVMDHAPDAEGAAAIGRRLLARVAEHPVTLASGTDVHVAARAGIALRIAGTEPPERVEPDVLVAEAEAALRRAGERGRAPLEVFDAELEAELRHRRALQQDLRGALGRGELHLAYQPVVRLDDHQLISVEALLRWRSPDHGAVRPDQFIALAEQSGLIVPVGHWVLDEACRQLADWRRLGLAPDRIAVNLSARQVADPALVDSVFAVLDRHGLRGGDLILELTETSLFDDGGPTDATLHRLKDLGVVLALDDFGTGYSSLEALQRLPIDHVKLDRTFIRGLGGGGDSERFVHAAQSMADALDLRLVAEGVETVAQADALRRVGCPAVQGFLFARPMAPDAIASVLHRDAGVLAPGA